MIARKAEEYWRASCLQRQGLIQGKPKEWTPPPEGFHKFNFDATFDTNEISFSSCVLRDHGGDILSVSSKDLVVDSFAAEAARYALPSKWENIGFLKLNFRRCFCNPSYEWQPPKYELKSEALNQEGKIVIRTKLNWKVVYTPWIL